MKDKLYGKPSCFDPPDQRPKVYKKVLSEYLLIQIFLLQTGRIISNKKEGFGLRRKMRNDDILERNLHLFSLILIVTLSNISGFF
jgi:hypothetical protein